MKRQARQAPAFQLYLLQHNRKESTIKRHVWNLRRILRDVKPLTKENIDRFFLSLKERGIKGSYLNSLVCSVRVYAQFKNIPELTSYRFFKNEPTIKATFSDEEIEAFLILPRKGNECIKTYYKWTIFFSLLAFSGMRPGEVAQLTIDDVDWGRNAFILQKTKTNIPRLVPIAPNIKSLLGEYIKTCPEPLLFPKNNGKPVNTGDWHYHFHKRIRRMEIKRKNLTAYSFRHSLATKLLEEDVNLFKVQKILGHRRISTTAIYTHMTLKDIQEALEKHPVIRRETSPKAILKALGEVIGGFRLGDDKRFGFKLTRSENSLNLIVYIK